MQHLRQEATHHTSRVAALVAIAAAAACALAFAAAGAFGAGGRHFCLGTALARLELNTLFEETLKRWPNMEIIGEPKFAESPFINQLKTLPVRLGS